MSQRFFVETPIQHDHAILTEAEAHHLLHVMRAKAGAEITLFDGSGAEFAGRVEKLGRSTVEVAVLERRSISREAATRVTLVVALPKGDRQKWLVEKAVELGVARLIPLHTERGVAQPVEQAVARLRRTVIEASKQCGRNLLMQIDSPVDWDDYVRDVSPKALRVIAHPGGKPLSSIDTKVATEIIAAIGPEGGFTEEEVALALRSGWQSVSLGERILRVETAALLLAGWGVMR